MSGLSPVPPSPETSGKSLGSSKQQKAQETIKPLERRIYSLIQSSDKQADHINTLLKKPNLNEKELRHLIEEFRDLRLIDIQLKHLKKNPELQHEFKFINARLAKHAALHNTSTAYYDKYYLEGDADLKYLTTHPQDEIAAREDLAKTNSKDSWKQKILQKLTPDSTARRCTAIMKKDMVDALTSRNEQALKNVQHNVSKLWTAFPAYMATIKQFDPKFYQLHEMLLEYVKADEKPAKKQALFAPHKELIKTYIIPETEFESVEKVKKHREQVQVEYIYTDPEEFEKVITTLRNTLKSTLLEFPSIIDKTLERISKSNTKKRLPRELSHHLTRFVMDTAYLFTFLESQKDLSIQQKREIHALREYMALVDNFITSCEKVKPLKQGMKTDEGGHVNKFDLINTGNKLAQLREDIVHQQKKHPI